ncbi:hypothetical protein INR49_000549 [Caranx melampygus]|nr:hypothetical protein INR49_000549 [Caranx melampygus]
MTVTYMSGRKKQLRREMTQEKDYQELEKALKSLSVSPAITSPELEMVYPESYRMNSPEEIRLLAMAENFQRQFAHLFPDRKPLLLCPVNECGVKKFVCTTVRPTLTVVSTQFDVLDWKGSASFVANFLSLDLLEPPVDPPRFLFSSTSVLQSQRATCFEFATLLCSLLLGSGYNAYCVSGYADKDMCLLDQSPQDCPLLDTNIKESERRLADPLRGLRVHCWVLVLTGRNGVQENFFIDPLTGFSYDTAHHNFLGIESVWNNLNYYVNMQDCRNGCTVEEKHQLFWMPVSWVSAIRISEKDLETCWPGGQKVTHYNHAKLEKFAPYHRPDGLVTRLTTYKDPEYTEVAKVKEWYQHRSDHLEEREVNKVDNFTTERFKSGSRFRFYSLSADSVHDMEFSTRLFGGVVRRVVSPGEMTETFENRDDFLYERHIIFNPQSQFPERCENCEGHVLKVVECFHRDESKIASLDLAKRVFLPTERKIKTIQHLEDHSFISTRRTFITPEESMRDEMSNSFTPDILFSIQECSSVRLYTKMMLKTVLMQLMGAEKGVIKEIQKSQAEVRDIVANRVNEQKNIKLVRPPWRSAGAAEAGSHTEETERLAEEEQRFLQDSEKDILAHLHIQLDKSNTLSPNDAKQLYQDCLIIFKHKLVEHANLIQERGNKETDFLQWKKEKTKVVEADCQDFCSKKRLQIEEAKKRLDILKTAAPQKYRDLDHKLRRHPGLASCPWSQ